MIILDLTCTANHRFEGWFASAQAFDDQCSRNMINCPVCGSQEIRRLPSAPHLAAPAMPEASRTGPANQAERLLAALVKCAAESEDVGERFPEEARRIHYGDAEERTIRGQASQDELRNLLDEGISVLPVPKPKEDLH